MELEHVLLPEDQQDHAPSQTLEDPVAPKAAEVLGYHEQPFSRGDLPRPASYTSVPKSQEHSEPSFSFSEDDLVPTKISWSNNSRHDDFNTTFQEQDHQPHTHIYSKSPDAPSDSRITVQRTLVVQGQGPHTQQPTDGTQHGRTQPTRTRMKEEQAKPTPQESEEAASRTKLTKSLSFGRKHKSERGKSRSPEKGSSSLGDGHASTASKANAASRPSKFFSRESSGKAQRVSDNLVKEERASSRALSRGRSMLSKKSTKAQSSTNNLTAADPSAKAPSEPTKRPVTPLLKSFSDRSLPSLSQLKTDKSPVPPLPGTLPTEKLSLAKERPPRRKDELWTVFRSLESDFAKFHSKSTALKANVVRSTLLPFLRDFADHPSNATLRPEDLDRRSTILNKWWNGLLDVLQGKSGSSVSGADRPVLLDGMAGIMERPEWRHPPSPFSPIADRAQAFQSTRVDSTASTGTEDFVIESVHHNVRNVFVQNLFAQMVYVVDKMSLKHAPASLVTFCGKACAYAFFFCPGISEILVRLWDVKPRTLQKVLQVTGLELSANLEAAAEVATVNFPYSTHPLIFKSVKELTKTLKKPPVLPLGVDKIKWHGHWVNRWSGRDSELFYAFTRYFHQLTLDFLTPGHSEEERISAPGIILVRAQMLSNLESTLHRQAIQSSAGGADSTVTFEELLDSDGPNAAVPTSPINAARMMSENRLVLILKDLIEERTDPSPALTAFYASSFCHALEAASRTVSVYDQTACFTLCDFLHEALVILIPYQVSLSDERPPLDWSFLTEVFKRMVESENTTTEIRLYSLIYEMWDSISEAEEWRREISIDFLLARDHFISTFNHWCPMVRAYYMRLVCWQLARYDGDATEIDVQILTTLMERLQEIWAYHRFLDKAMQDKGALRPSTAPCNPAPGRKLLIIRTDTQVPTPLLSFNNMLAAADDSGNTKSPPSEPTYGSSMSTASSLLEKVSATLEYGVDVSRKRSSLLRSLWGTKPTEVSEDGQSSSESPGRNGSPASSPNKSKENSRRASPEKGNSRSSMYEQRPSQLSLNTSAAEQGSPPPTNKRHHQLHADFKFSLEAVDRRPHTFPGDMALEKPRLPLAAQLFVQSISSEQEEDEKDPGPSRPKAEYTSCVRYAGRALAEWTWVVNECQNFFERRRNEGVPSNRQVETPSLGVEPFRRPG